MVNFVIVKQKREHNAEIIKKYAVFEPAKRAEFCSFILLLIYVLCYNKINISKFNRKDKLWNKKKDLS